MTLIINTRIHRVCLPRARCHEHGHGIHCNNHSERNRVLFCTRLLVWHSVSHCQSWCPASELFMWLPYTTKVWSRFRNFCWTFWTNARIKIQSYSTPAQYEVQKSLGSLTALTWVRRSVNDWAHSSFLKIVQISNRVSEKHFRVCNDIKDIASKVTNTPQKSKNHLLLWTYYIRIPMTPATK